MLKKAKPYILSILISLGVGVLSALVTYDSMNIYEKINVPTLAPPSIIFPIVWSVLFILMGISAGLVYTKKEENPRLCENALSLYTVNLCVNFIWSVLFFNIGAYLFSFIWILLLLSVIFAMTLFFYKVRHVSAYLQIPYILWVAFAAYLNLAIWILNK